MTEHSTADSNGSVPIDGPARSFGDDSDGAAAVDPGADEVDAAIERASVLLAQGQTEAAERELRRAIQLAPNRADPHIRLGVALLKRAVYPAAAAALRRATELAPDSAQAHLLLGETLNQLGEPTEAILALENVIRLGPSSKAFYSLGIAYDCLGEPELAADMYRNSRDLNGR